jgi:hypothetical protein
MSWHALATHAADRLFVFMEPASPKGHDLRRDGRYVLHCAATGEQPWNLHEFYVDGIAHQVDDPAARQIANAGTGLPATNASCCSNSRSHRRSPPCSTPTANPSDNAGAPPLAHDRPAPGCGQAPHASPAADHAPRGFRGATRQGSV